VLKLLIDWIYDTFTLYDDDERRVHLVGGRGCLKGASDWDNELHPDSKGFEQLAMWPWRAALAKFGFAWRRRLENVIPSKARNLLFRDDEKQILRPTPTQNATFRYVLAPTNLS
jgi:hypothetical protein